MNDQGIQYDINNIGINFINIFDLVGMTDKYNKRDMKTSFL